jgi:uncharacterized protein YggE
VGSPVLRSATGVGGVQITGFVATETVTATLHDVAAAGRIVSLVTDSTGDSGTVQVTYTVADDRSVREQARTAAIHQAQANARRLAADAGVALGDIASLAEMRDTATSSGTFQESVDMVYAVGG